MIKIKPSLIKIDTFYQKSIINKMFKTCFNTDTSIFSKRKVKLKFNVSFTTAVLFL